MTDTRCCAPSPQKQGLDVQGVVCHVSDDEQRRNLISTAVRVYGGLDILVSNAAVNPTFGTLMQVRRALLCIGLGSVSVCVRMK